MAGEDGVRIANIVSTAKLSPLRDLSAAVHLLTPLAKEVSYVKTKFPGLILKHKNGVTLLIFSTGKVIITGTTDIEKVKEAIKSVVIALRGLFTEQPRSVKISIQNIVATASLPYKVNLEEMPEGVYDPDTFPGLILKVGIEWPTVLIFSSGRIVIVGAKSVEKIKQTYELVLQKTSKYAVS